MLAAHVNAHPPAAPRPEAALFTLSPVNNLQTPTPLERGFIWHPAGQPFLVYQPFNGATPQLYDWTNGIPKHWQLVPTLRAEGIYHLIWQNNDASLWRAQIDRTGERRLAAIEVARTADNFTATTTRLGQTVLLWTVEGDVLGTVLDNFGRPLQQLTTLSNITSPALLDIQSSGDRRLNLSWLDQNGRLFYGATADLVDFSGITSIQPELDAGEWIDDLLLVVAANETYTIWAQADMTTPTTRTLYALAWSTGNVQPLLNGQAVRGMASVSGLAPGYAFPFVATTVQTSNGWRSAYIDLNTDQLTTLAHTNPQGNAPHLWFDLQGDLQASAWRTSNSADEVVYIAQSPILRNVTPKTPPTTRRWLADGLLNLPQGLPWLVLVAILASLLRLVSRQITAMWALLAAYVVVQSIYPGGLFQPPAPLLGDIALSAWGSALLILTIHLVASLIARVFVDLYRPGFLGMFFALDTLLCFLIFGGNLN